MANLSSSSSSSSSPAWSSCVIPFAKSSSKFLRSTSSNSSLANWICRCNSRILCLFSFASDKTRWLNSYSPLCYNLNCRNYYSVLSGSIEVTLCPPKDYKYLYVNKDYDNFKFTSAIDILNPQDEYKNEFDKVKFLRVVLEPNRLLQIPAYWFFSIKILESNTLISNFKYTTYMNSLAMAPELFIKFLQNNNIKKNVAKVADL